MGEVKKTTLLLILLYAFILFGLISIYLGKDNNYDLRNYHYYQVFAFLNNRLDFDYLPCQLGTFLNPAINFLSYFLINNLPPMMAGFILGGIHGFNYWLLFVLSFIVLRQAFPSQNVIVQLVFSLISAAVGVYGSAFFPEIGTTFNDNVISIFVLTAVLLIIKWIMSDFAVSHLRKRCYFVLSGLCLGIGIGFKLTAMIYGLGIFLAISFLLPSWKDKVVVNCFWGAGVLVGALATGGYWMVKLWGIYGNPIFPYFNQLFHSPYYAPVNFFDKRFLPEGLLQNFFYPYYFCVTNSHVMEHPFRDIRWAVIYILILVLLFGHAFYFKNRNQKSLVGAGKQSEILKFFLIFYVASYIAWQFEFSIYRYLIALDLLAPIMIFLLYQYVLKNYKAVMTATLITFLGIIFTAQMPDWGRLHWGSTFFEVEVPKIENPGNSIVVVTQPKAWSYLFPYFPSSMRFVRINTALTKPGDDNQFQTEMRKLIIHHQGPIYLLSNVIYELEDKEIIAQYGLKVATDEILPIKSKHELPGLQLCKLQKINADETN